MLKLSGGSHMTFTKKTEVCGPFEPKSRQSFPKPRQVNLTRPDRFLKMFLCYYTGCNSSYIALAMDTKEPIGCYLVVLYVMTWGENMLIVLTWKNHEHSFYLVRLMDSKKTDLIYYRFLIHSWFTKKKKQLSWWSWYYQISTDGYLSAFLQYNKIKSPSSMFQVCFCQWPKCPRNPGS